MRNRRKEELEREIAMLNYDIWQTKKKFSPEFLNNIKFWRTWEHKHICDCKDKISELEFMLRLLEDEEI